MEKVYRIIRIVTLAPLLAGFSLLAIAVFNPEVFPSLWHFAYMLLFLTVLPLTAYPLQKFIPHFKDKGRSGQRTLAMIFAVAGYLLCLIVNIFSSATAGIWLITLEYLISGKLILFVNKALHIKISAHGCGTVGPVFLLVYFGVYIPAAIMCIFSVASYIASVKAKHHTLPQLIGGSAVSVLVLAVLALLFRV
ncbi:MAG: hypothetical protein IJX27_05215 [Clostridia bacterium]|nr:hypothetical protein [Clostridia bacterium]